MSDRVCVKGTYRGLSYEIGGFPNCYCYLLRLNAIWIISEPFPLVTQANAAIRQRIDLVQQAFDQHNRLNPKTR